MEPNTINGEITNKENTVGVVEDSCSGPNLDIVKRPPDEVQFVEQDDGIDYYQAEVLGMEQCYQTELVEPILDILDAEFEDVFLFSEDGFVARAPLSGEGEWNAVVARYHPSSE